MEDNVEYGMLDLNSDAEVIEYERGVFKSFYGQSSGVIRNYEIVGDDRLRPKLPYENLDIYTIREGGRLISASAVNTNISEYCQLVNMNININSIINVDIERVCEGLGLFTLESNVSPFEIGSYMSINVFKKMKERGYLEYYASSDKKIARLYTKLYHFKKIDEFKYDDQSYCLLKVELDSQF